MPERTGVNHGRGFDMYENLLWLQRVDKEERAVLGEDRFDYKKRRRERVKQDARIRRLEEQVVGGSANSSRNASMYKSNSLPEKFRALQQWPVTDKPIITTRLKKQTESLVPKLRFKSAEVEAMWVPGTHKILQHSPEFYLEDQNAPKAQNTIESWRLPAAGQRCHDKPPQVVATPSLPIQSRGLGAFAEGSATSGKVVEGSTARSWENQFQIGARPGRSNLQGDSSDPRKEFACRSGSLLLAGNSAVSSKERPATLVGRLGKV